MRFSLKQRGGILLQYLKPQREQALLMAVFLLSSIGLQLLNPQIVRHFIDVAAAGGALDELLRTALLFLGIALTTQLTAVAATYFGERVSWRATNALRADLSLHCLKLDMSFHNARTPGELIERIDGDVTAIATFFSQLVVRVFGSFLLTIGVLALLFREDWRAGLILSVFALVALAVLNSARDIAVPSLAADREIHARLFGFIEERLAGLDDVRANGGGSYTMRRLTQIMRNVLLLGRHAIMMATLIWIISRGLFAVGYALALAVGVYLFGAGAITIGTVFLFFQYTELLRQPLEQIADQLNEFQKASAGILRVQELLTTRRQIVDGPGADLGTGALTVEFDGVGFSYDATNDERRTTNDRQRTISNLQSPISTPMTLEGVSFRLEPGAVLGLLGRTGSGKTTMTRLLFRLYDPTQGVIRLNGKDIRDARLNDVRRRIGIVTQDVQLFQASVRDNLTLFDSSIPDKRILQVVEDLELDSWLAELPRGLDSELATGGSGLSAGEAQLLAFARVFLRDPGLVILDEASSRLDPATERQIEHAVDVLLRDRTGIIIAHRLATVQRADEILILDGGRIREYGPRAELANDPTSRFSELLRTGMAEVLG
jgi:ABC-type multidrug transport system fused ATPase/permease subunit